MSLPLFTALAPALAFVLALIGTAVLLRTRWQWAMDTPNERSLHSNVVPLSLIHI